MKETRSKILFVPSSRVRDKDNWRGISLGLLFSFIFVLHANKPLGWIIMILVKIIKSLSSLLCLQEVGLKKKGKKEDRLLLAGLQLTSQTVKNPCPFHPEPSLAKVCWMEIRVGYIRSCMYMSKH